VINAKNQLFPVSARDVWVWVNSVGCESMGMGAWEWEGWNGMGCYGELGLVPSFGLQHGLVDPVI
jgi:hypothetical protein